MAIRREFTAREIDSALAGDPKAPGLEGLSVWAQQVRDQAGEPLDDAIAAAHIASITAIAAGGPAPTSTAKAPAMPLMHRIRRRLVLGSFVSGMAAKIFAASVAFAAVTGGVAATGALPDMIQDPIATVYNSVGFDFPTSTDDECDSATDQDCSTESPTTDPSDGEGKPDGEVQIGPSNNNGNKNGPDNTSGNKTEPADNNGKGPGNNNGNGPDENSGSGPGENSGNGPDENNRPGDDPGGDSDDRKDQDGGDEG